MQNLNKMKALLPLVSSILLLAMAGCSLDDGGGSTQSAPLTLTVTKNKSLIRLDWNEVNVTGFSEYVILQSGDSIPDSPQPVTSQDVTLLGRIDDRHQSTFSALPPLNSSRVCYKVYCSVDDRFMQTQSVCVQPDIDVLPGFMEVIVHESDLPEMAMFDRQNSQLNSYNYETGVVTKNIFESELQFPILDISTYQNQTALFAFDQSTIASLRKYSFPALEFLKGKTLSSSIQAACVQGNFVFVCTQGTNQGFQVINRDNLVATDTRTSTNQLRNLVAFGTDTITALEISNANIRKVVVSPLGKILTETNIAASNLRINSQSTCDASSSLYVGGQNAVIINKDGEVVTRLINSNNAFVSLSRFSADERYAGIVLTNNGIIQLDVYDVTLLPAAQRVFTVSLPTNASYLDLIIRDDTIYLLGLDFQSSSGQTFTYKFPFAG